MHLLWHQEEHAVERDGMCCVGGWGAHTRTVQGPNGGNQLLRCHDVACHAGQLHLLVLAKMFALNLTTHGLYQRSNSKNFALIDT